MKIFRDIILISLSVAIGFFLIKTNLVSDVLTATKELRLIGSFLAGFFFTSIFTVVPATVVIVELAARNYLWELAIAGGLGALVGDSIIFFLIRGQLTGRFVRQFGETRLKKLVVKDILKLKPIRWLAFLIGALFIASPLPNEFGLALMGISKINIFYFFISAWILNTIGILIVGGIAIYFG